MEGWFGLWLLLHNMNLKTEAVIGRLPERYQGLVRAFDLFGLELILAWVLRDRLSQDEDLKSSILFP